VSRRRADHGAGDIANNFERLLIEAGDVR